MKNISIFFLVMAVCLTGCEDYLDRENLDTLDEQNFWTSATSMKLYAYGSYSQYFTGYGQGNSHGNYFTFGPWSDEFSSGTGWTQNTATSGNGWSFYLVRRHNIMINRVDLLPENDEVKNHWRGVARFFRAMEYADLTRLFGDIPWYDTEIMPSDVELMYKDRDPMPFVATKILEDYTYAVANVREDQPVSDDDQQVNRDVVLAYMSRNLLYLGTFMKYHDIDQEVSTLLLEKAKWAAEQLITSGKYAISDDYRALFTSADLKANKEVIFFRQYETAKLTHALIQYVNIESQTGSTLRLVNSYLAADGFPIKQSPQYDYDADNGRRLFPAQYAGRDPRMAATLVDTIRISGAHASPSTTGFVCWKFLPYDANNKDLIYQGTGSVTDAPVMRYGEVLLNYAEAAAELGQFGQADADKTINKLRNRSILKGGKGTPLPKLPAMTVSGEDVLVGGIPIDDPDRDPAVSPLLWEIRREREVELVYEGFRKNDLRRWNKFEYLKTVVAPGAPPTDLSLGAYIDFTRYSASVQAKIKTNLKFYYPDVADQNHAFINTLVNDNQKRDWIPGAAFYEKQYLNSVPLDQITLYKSKGFELSQNPGWD